MDEIVDMSPKSFYQETFGHFIRKPSDMLIDACSKGAEVKEYLTLKSLPATLHEQQGLCSTLCFFSLLGRRFLFCRMMLVTPDDRGHCHISNKQSLLAIK